MSDYVKRYEDWPQEVFVTVRLNEATGEYETVRDGQVSCTWLPEDFEAAMKHAKVSNTYINHMHWMRQVPYPLPPERNNP